MTASGEWCDLDALRIQPQGTVQFGYDVDLERAWEFHVCHKGAVVGGLLPSATWQVVSTSPLTVTPSIWCKPPEGCGLHGFIRNGEWMSA